MNGIFRVWNRGKIFEIEIGREVTVVKFGSGKTVYGEKAILKKATQQHLVFETETKAIVKTPIRNISYTIGRARKNGYSVTLKKIEDFENIIKQKTSYILK